MSQVQAAELTANIPSSSTEESLLEKDPIGFVYSLPNDTWKKKNEKSLAAVGFFYPQEVTISQLSEFTNISERCVRVFMDDMAQPQRGLVKLRLQFPKLREGPTKDSCYFHYTVNNITRTLHVSGNREKAQAELEATMSQVSAACRIVEGCTLNVPRHVSIQPIPDFNRRLIQHFATLTFHPKTIDNFVLRTFAYKASAPNREVRLSTNQIGRLLSIRKKDGLSLTGDKGALRRVEKAGYMRRFPQYGEKGKIQNSLYQLANERGHFAAAPKDRGLRPPTTETLLINALRRYPDETAADLAEHIGRKVRTVEDRLSRMKRQGKVTDTRQMRTFSLLDDNKPDARESKASKPSKEAGMGRPPKEGSHEESICAARQASGDDIEEF